MHNFVYLAQRHSHEFSCEPNFGGGVPLWLRQCPLGPFKSAYGAQLLVDYYSEWALRCAVDVECRCIACFLRIRGKCTSRPNRHASVSREELRVNVFNCIVCVYV